MNGFTISLRGASLMALASGALFWPDRALLCVSDLHLGKSNRIARREGRMLPPYESRETLDRLAADIDNTAPQEVVCLGDSFDDLAAARDLEKTAMDQLSMLMAGRRWVWIEGNHDPGPVGLGGSHQAELSYDPITFRHIAEPGKAGEISGHYHPKAGIRARGRFLSKRCFLVDAERIILPAYGAYTGGLYCDHPALSGLMSPEATVLLLPGDGKPPMPIPMPR